MTHIGIIVAVGVVVVAAIVYFFFDDIKSFVSQTIRDEVAGAQDKLSDKIHENVSSRVDSAMGKDED